MDGWGVVAPLIMVPWKAMGVRHCRITPRPPPLPSHQRDRAINPRRQHKTGKRFCAWPHRGHCSVAPARPPGLSGLLRGGASQVQIASPGPAGPVDSKGRSWRPGGALCASSRISSGTGTPHAARGPAVALLNSSVPAFRPRPLSLLTYGSRSKSLTSVGH